MTVTKVGPDRLAAIGGRDRVVPGPEPAVVTAYTTPSQRGRRKVQIRTDDVRRPRSLDVEGLECGVRPDESPYVRPCVRGDATFLNM
jgi:hypothetical protein